MVQESQTPRVTSIQVRVDCNGCAQKIKKALSGINGIHDLHIDFDRQRVTIIGWADPEKIVNAIKKKARKNATIICSSIETFASKPTKPKPKENPPAPQAQGTSFPEPMLEATSSSSSPPPPTPICHNARKQWQNNPANGDVEQVHMLDHHHQSNHVNRLSSGHNYVDHRDRSSSYHNGPVFLQESSQIQPLNVTHSYNTYMPSSYVTEYECVRSSSWHTHYRHMEHYNNVEYNYNNVNIAAMFSDDNPNSCCIV